MVSAQRSLADADSLEQGISLYVHIPFCQTKCPYCDFNTYQGIEALMEPYAEALVQEIRLWGETLGRPGVNTIFFGGGTPSYIPIDHLVRILAAAGQAFQVSEGAETTVEANPGDLNGPALERLLGIGVNRLSIGVQSLDDPLLSMLGRRHSAAEAEDAYRLAGGAGFHSVNLDLMYGLPRQTMAQWTDTLDRVLEMAPPHLSVYCLTLEEGTPLEATVRRGTLPEPDPDLAADMYAAAREVLGGAGYRHYEISNWAKPGHECRHNLTYWLNRPYLGVGPGGHSYLHGHRFWTVKSPRGYIQSVNAWASDKAAPVQKFDPEALTELGPVDGAEPIGPELEMAETMILGLRLLDGLSIDDFVRRFSLDPLQIYGTEIRESEEQGLLEQSDGVLRLTDKGCLLSNQVFIRFL